MQPNLCQKTHNYNHETCEIFQVRIWCVITILLVINTLIY